MGPRLSVSSNDHVVIVGAGFGGIAAAKQLSSYRIPYTLIDIKYAFHHNMGALRASVQEGFAKKTFIPYDLTFKANFKQGKVIDIDLQDQGVIMENGEVIRYSYLILATGSTGPFPGKLIESVSRETAIQMYEDLVKEIQVAETIVIVGGGLAGVELAAEIKTDYPMKEVTLIHSTYILGDSEVLPSVRRGVKEILVNKGVQLLLGHKVNNLTELVLNKAQKDIKVVTDKGKEIIADMVTCCTGIKINSSAYVNALRDNLTEHDAIIVDEHLNVRGMKVVFAIGDCAHVNEHKSAYTAEFQANTCVKNIIHSLKHEPMELYKPGHGDTSNIKAARQAIQTEEILMKVLEQDEPTLRSYPEDLAYYSLLVCSSYTLYMAVHQNTVIDFKHIKNLTLCGFAIKGAPYMMVTMGRNDGIGQMCGCNVGKMIVTYVKSKDLLVKTSWKKMGQKMPK